MLQRRQMFHGRDAERVVVLLWAWWGSTIPWPSLKKRYLKLDHCPGYTLVYKIWGLNSAQSQQCSNVKAGRKGKKLFLFLRFIGEVWTKYWCWCSAENLDLGQYALLRKKPSGWVSQMSVLIQLKEPPVKENRFNIKAMVSQSSLAKVTLPLTRWLRHTEEKQKLKSQSQSFETKMARRSVCGAEEGGWWWWMVECVCWMSEMCVVDACDKKEYSLKDQQPLIWHHLNLTVLQFNSTLT